MKKVSLIIPIYNEAPHLKEFLLKVDALDLKCPKELVFVDDASKDNSFEILQNFSFHSETQILQQSLNHGKGAALHRAIDAATGDIIAVQDADFEYDMQDLPELIAPLQAGKADVVYGSRFRKNGLQVHRTFHYLINRLLTLMSNVFSGLYLSDMETCYKIFHSDLLKNIIFESKRFGFEPEVTAKIARLKLRILEMPISYFPRNYLEGKKINWKDGVAAFWHIFKFNCLRREFRYSYKDTLPSRYRTSGTQWL